MTDEGQKALCCSFQALEALGRRWEKGGEKERKMEVQAQPWSMGNPLPSVLSLLVSGAPRQAQAWSSSRKSPTLVLEPWGAQDERGIE